MASVGHGLYRSLLWECRPVLVSVEEAFHSKLVSETEESLLAMLVDGSLPSHDGLTEHQATNLLRRHLRELMGNDRFLAIPAVGTKQGEKEAANLLETAVANFLTTNNVSFMSKHDIRSAPIPQAKKLSSSQASQWRKSTIDASNRQLFVGSCGTCSEECQVPFKPVAGRTAPQCWHCRNVLTPDFVPSNLVINGVPINWIDCKCYYGSATFGIFGGTSLQRVAKDYTARWGPGAVIFAFGFCDEFKVDGLSVLDCSPLDMTDLNEFLDQSPFRIARRMKKQRVDAKTIVAATV